MEHVSASVSQRPSLDAPEPMTVLVIDDQYEVGSALAAELRRDGHDVHVRTGSEELVDEVELLDPQVIVLHLCAGRRGGETLTWIRRRFAHVHVIVYTSATVETVRSQLKPDLVLRGDSPAVLAQQFRCWSRYV